jgi:hypothetical protein
MVEATLKPGGGGIMDMALAARGDFLAVSVEESARPATAGVVVFKADLTEVVTVLEAGLAEADFLAASGVLAAAGFFEGTTFLTGAAFFVAAAFLATAGFLAGTTFLAATTFLAGTTFFAGTTFLAATTFLAGTAFLATAFFVATVFLTGTAFFWGEGFLAATGVFKAFALGFAAVTLVLIMALLWLECFTDFNAILLTARRGVHQHPAPYCFWLLSQTSSVTSAISRMKNFTLEPMARGLYSAYALFQALLKDILG